MTQPVSRLDRLTLRLTTPKAIAAMILILGFGAAFAIWQAQTAGNKATKIEQRVIRPTRKQIRAGVARAIDNLDTAEKRRLFRTLLESAGPRERQELLDLIRRPTSAQLTPGEIAQRQRAAASRRRSATRRADRRRRAARRRRARSPRDTSPRAPGDTSPPKSGATRPPASSPPAPSGPPTPQPTSPSRPPATRPPAPPASSPRPTTPAPPPQTSRPPAVTTPPITVPPITTPPVTVPPVTVPPVPPVPVDPCVPIVGRTCRQAGVDPESNSGRGNQGDALADRLDAARACARERPTPVVPCPIDH